MSLTLRPYQTDLYERAKARLRAGVRTLLLTSPTGSGKTVLIAHMLRNAAQKGYRAWFVVHRRELVKQSVLTLAESAGLPLGIVAAGFPGNRFEPIQVCSVQSLKQRQRLLPKPDLIVWDESHHVAAGSWASIHSEYPNAVHIGLTATPERLDGTGLGAWFEEIVTGPSVSELIQQGWLSRYRLYAPSSVNLEGVHTVAGDYNKRELSAAMESSAVTGDAVAHYQRYASGRRAVVFMWSVESSIQMAQRFNDAGIPAAHIDGKTNDSLRDSTIDQFRSGQIKVLTNVDIVSEGFDLPAIEAAFLLRPTRSLGLYLQQVGRALRPVEGKAEALIFDHAGNCKMHGLPDDDREWSLDGRRRTKADRDECPVKQCPKCYAMVRAHVSVCKWCEFVFKAEARTMEQIEGELTEIDAADLKQLRIEQRKQEERACRTLDELVALGRRRGYAKPEGWAHHVYQRRNAWRARWHSGDMVPAERMR